MSHQSLSCLDAASKLLMLVYAVCAFASGPVSGQPVKIDEVLSEVESIERDARISRLDRLLHEARRAKFPAEILRLPDSGLVPQDRPLAEDLLVNDALEQGYLSIAASDNPADQADMIALALRHWMILVRRFAGPTMTTEVSELQADPECSGDMMGDRGFPAYFDALASSAAPLEREQAIIAALSVIARIETCISARQSALFALAASRAFTDVATVLRDNGYEHLVERMAGALSAPLLLVHDVEKRRGPLAPLFGWFKENRDALIQLAHQGRLPSAWHKLWLYDWRLGRMLGFKAAGEGKATSENEVDLVAFLKAITDPRALGDYSCSFSDIVQRGSTPIGYACAAGMCLETSAQSAAVVRTPLARLTSRPVMVVRGAPEKLCRGELPVPVVGGDPRCETPVELAGISREAATIECISTQTANPGAQGLSCMIEKTGSCADPLDGFVKEIDRVAMAGVKWTPGCSDPVGDPGFTAKQLEEQKQQFLEAEQELFDKLWDNKKKEARGEITAEQKINLDAEAKAEYNAKIDEINRNSPNLKDQGLLNATHDAKREEIDSNYINNPASRAEANSILNEWFNHLTDQVTSGKISWEDAAQMLSNMSFTPTTPRPNRPAGGPECLDVLGNCAPTSCSARADALSKTVDCVSAAFSQQEINPVESCDPTVCDDFDATGPLPAAAQCFTDIVQDPLTHLAQACWDVRCGPGMTPTVVGQSCQCREEGVLGQDPRLGDLCSQMLCTEGVPIVRNGQCQCGRDEPLSGPVPVFDLPDLPDRDPQIDILFGPGELPRP